MRREVFYALICTFIAAVNGVCDRQAVATCFGAMQGSNENMQAQCAAYETVKTCIAPHKDACGGDPYLAALAGLAQLCGGGAGGAGGAGGGTPPNIPTTVNGVCDRYAVTACFDAIEGSFENMQEQCAAYETVKTCIAPHKDACAGDPILQAIARSEKMCGDGLPPNIPNMCVVDVCAMSMQKYMPQGEGETPIVEASPDMCAAATQYKTCVENGRSQCPDSQSVKNAEMMIKQFESLCGGQNDKVTSTTSSYTKETEENLKRGSNKRRTLAELKKENLILDNERLREETKRLKLEQENLKLEKEGIILKNRCLICKVQTEYPDCVAP